MNYGGVGVNAQGPEPLREAPVRLPLLTLGIVLVASAIGTSAEAQNYPWCAYYGDDFGGTNCGFVSYDQCMMTVTGIGGFCDRNTQYVPPGQAMHPSERARSQRKTGSPS
jgi:Protein of unknown function (DUF3551)